MNAIILAAGLGSRLKPLTNQTPKSQIKINGTPMIERQIEFLRAKGVNEIIVVTGYLHSKFEYLQGKYDVELVYNDKFAEYNNIYSMYLVGEKFGNSFVIDADIYLHNNFISSDLEVSTYFSVYKNGFDNEEWMLDYNEATKKLENVVIVKDRQSQGRIMSGVSYWTADDAIILKKKIQETIKNRDFANLHWDYMVVENLGEIDVYVKELRDFDLFEVDTLRDLENLEELVKSLA